jgi:uncharacterized membrane protein
VTLIKKIKSNSIVALRRHWVKALSTVFLILGMWLVFTMLETLVSDLFNIIPYASAVSGGDSRTSLVPEISALSVVSAAISALLAYIIFVPVSAGLRRFFSCVAYSKETQIFNLFYFFRIKKFFKILGLHLNVFGRSLLWLMLFFFPAVLLFFFSLQYGAITLPISRLNDMELTSLIMLAFCVAFALLALIFAIIFAGRYYLAVYILISNPTIKIRQCIKKSVYCTKGRLGDLFIFKLSFILWFFSCAALVPLLFVLPYYSTACAIFAEYLIEHNRRYEIPKFN